MYPGRAWRGYFRLRLQGIRYSNKPAIRLKAIRERKNSLRSDNILSLINAAPQTLTISNVLPQSPSASPPRPSRKVHQQGCIRPIFCVHPIICRSDFGIICQKKLRDWKLMLSRKMDCLNRKRVVHFAASFLIRFQTL